MEIFHRSPLNISLLPFYMQSSDQKLQEAVPWLFFIMRKGVKTFSLDHIEKQRRGATTEHECNFWSSDKCYADPLWNKKDQHPTAKYYSNIHITSKILTRISSAASL